MATSCITRFPAREIAARTREARERISSLIGYAEQKIADAPVEFPPDPCVNFFDNFTEAVDSAIGDALNSKVKLSPAMMQLLCAVIFAGYTIGGPGDFVSRPLGDKESN